jgi:hypothetical protein
MDPNATQWYSMNLVESRKNGGESSEGIRVLVSNVLYIKDQNKISAVNASFYLAISSSSPPSFHLQ